MVWVDLGEYGGYDDGQPYAASPLAAVAAQPEDGRAKALAYLNQRYPGIDWAGSSTEFLQTQVPFDILTPAEKQAQTERSRSMYGAEFGADAERQALLDRIAGYQTSSGALQSAYGTGYGAGYNPLDASRMGLLQTAPLSELQKTAVQYDPSLQVPNWLLGGGYDLRDSKPMDYVSMVPGKQYVLYDAAGNKVLASGSDEAAFRTIAGTVKNTLAPQGRKANWQLYEVSSSPDAASSFRYGEPQKVGEGEGAQYFTPIAGDLPNKSALGQIADMALPALGAILLPGVGGLAGALGSVGASAAGSALGSTLSGALQGKDIGDIAKGALLSGAGAYLGGSLLQGLNPSRVSGASAATASGGSSAFNAAFAPGFLEAPLAAGAAGAASGAGDIIVNAIRGISPAALGGVAGSLAPSILANLSPLEMAQMPDFNYDPNDIVVEANKTPAATSAGGSAIGTGAVNIPGTSTFTPEEGITVTADKLNKPADIGALTGAMIPAALTPSTSTPSTPATPATPKKDLTLSDYIQLAGLGLGLVGGAAGGSKTGNAVIPGGLGGGLSPVFGSELPAANIPGLGTGGAGLGARTAEDLAGRGLSSPQDYYRYGYGPEQSFFTNVPQGAKNTSTALTGYEQPFKGLENMAEGGYAVGGPGDGREDKIPAMLSDGEYVMDAETVAMLGNGSSKAGADALDRFRVNIRKHKGKALAKGSFSVNAKKPEQYLKKGRG